MKIAVTGPQPRTMYSACPRDRIYAPVAFRSRVVSRHEVLPCLQDHGHLKKVNTCTKCRACIPKRDFCTHNLHWTCCSSHCRCSSTLLASLSSSCCRSSSSRRFSSCARLSSSIFLKILSLSRRAESSNALSCCCLNILSCSNLFCRETLSCSA